MVQYSLYAYCCVMECCLILSFVTIGYSLVNSQFFAKEDKEMSWLLWWKTGNCFVIIAFTTSTTYSTTFTYHYNTTNIPLLIAIE